MPESLPKVSIIIPSYNHAKYVSEAIHSALNQTYINFEIIIVDDGSTDESVFVINNIVDPRIRFNPCEENRGANVVVNEAIAQARGEYIAILNSDDVWISTKLEKQIEVLEKNPDIAAVFSDAIVIDEEGAVLTDVNHFYYNIFTQPNKTRYEWLRHFFINGNTLCHPSLLIRKSCYEKCGRYSLELNQLPDFDMWIRVCLKFEIYVLNEKLVKFRIMNEERNSSGNTAENRIRSCYEGYIILFRFLEIKGFDELVNIFPSAEKYRRNGEEDVQFAMAMTMLAARPFFLVQLFCQNIIHNALTDSYRSLKINKLYNFSHKDFISLTAKNDVFHFEEKINEFNVMIKEINSLKEELKEKEKEFNVMNREINRLKEELKEINKNMEFDISLANERVRMLETLLESMTASKSWKITAPMRYLVRIVLRIKVKVMIRIKTIDFGGMQKKALSVIYYGGSLGGSLKIFSKILIRDGLRGLKNKIKQIINVGDKYLPDSSIDFTPYYLNPFFIEDSKEINVSQSIGIHLHLHYGELLGEVSEYLNNVPYAFDLFVSITESLDVNDVKNSLKRLKNVNKIVVERVENRGRNISPFIVQFGSRLCEYDIVAHIHSKKSTHRKELDSWFSKIADTLFGQKNSSGSEIIQIVRLLNEDAKIIYAEPSFFNITTQSGWDDNYKIAKDILNKYTKLNIEDFPINEFPQGFMFWAKCDCLKSFLRLPIKYDDFPEEPISADATLAHALERLILVFASTHEGKVYRLHRDNSFDDYKDYEEQREYLSKSSQHPDIKVLSYYLPQFHPIPENDEWHGKGFTEWTKVRQANPLFYGHYQQHIPHSDIGYYLLDSPETLIKQVDLMEKSGVYGQVFYHYWFTGKLILEEPAQVLLENTHINMPFCFCWANENWTRRWDGNEKEILLAQKYSAEDAKAFINYLIPFFNDSRYIKIDNRPVLFIYRATSIPNINEYLNAWESECNSKGIAKPYVVAVMTRGVTNPLEFNLDAGVERVLHDWTDGAVQEMKNLVKPYRQINGSILAYDDVADFYINQKESKPFTYFRSLVPIWDNTARYGSEAYVVHQSTSKKFQDWLESSIEYSENNLPKDRQYVVVNAWNEWAEGAHLEPDSKNGYSYLNSIGRALSNTPHSGKNYKEEIINDNIIVEIKIPDAILQSSDSENYFFKKMLDCFSSSTLTKKCKVITKSNQLAKVLNIEHIETTNADFKYVIEVRCISIFGHDALENLIKMASYYKSSVIIANSFDSFSETMKVEDNLSVDRHQAHDSPLVVYPQNLNNGYKNFKLCPEARCFVTKDNDIPVDKLPVVTTILRFHKSGDLTLLRNALISLIAMNNCIVKPMIATQDLSEEQLDELTKMIDLLPFEKTYPPEVVIYKSQNGQGDIRSKLLNESLFSVKTKYAAFLDYDDLLFPDAYRWMIDRLEKTKKGVVFGRVFVANYDDVSQRYIERLKTYEYGYKFNDFVINNNAPLHSFMLNIEKLDLKNIVYHENQKYMEDYYLTLQLFTPNNADWDSLSENYYIGDYIHSINRDHTLAVNDNDSRNKILNDKEYIRCDLLIHELRMKIMDKFNL